MIGCVTLRFFGRERCIRGGPFDAFCPPGIGMCLEACSSRAATAMVALPIDDYAAPTPGALADGLVALLRAMRAAPELPVYIGCRAGLGRTGMLIAALAKLAGQSDPVGWTRHAYDRRAVETAAQEQAITAIDVPVIWRRLEGPA